MAKLFLGLLTGGAVLYASICVVFYVYQEALIYFPAREVRITPSDFGLQYSDVWLQTEDGVKLHGWVVPAAGDLWVLFCHGNAGNIANRLDDVRMLHQMGAGTLFFDYRGYGRSEGTPTEDGLYRDAEAAFEYLMGRARSAEHIIVMGESLGGAVAVELASRHAVGGLMLRSTFTSLPELGAQLYPWIPVRWLCRNRFPSRERIRHLSCRKLIAHSPQDEIVPFSHGRALFEAAAEPKSWVQLVGHHNTPPPQLGEDYRRGLSELLASASVSQKISH